MPRRRRANRTGTAAGHPQGGDLAAVDGLSFRRNGEVVHTPDRQRIADLDSIPFPAFAKVDLSRYEGYA